MNNPKVSVIIPTYNCVKFLSEAIESVIKQSYQDFEIIVVDDGSADSTKNIMDQYLQKYGPKIKYIYQDNSGLACARNTGIKIARGQYIALLDADDKWLPERLSEGVKLMESDNRIGLVHTNITVISENGRIIRIPKRKTRYLSGMIFEHIFLRNADIACPTVLLKKQAIDKVGMFDENLARLGCEDRELWLRISQYYKIGYINKELAYYRDRISSMSKNTQKMLEARYYVVNKFFPENIKINRLRNKALANIHRELGDSALLSKDFTESRIHYIKALSFWPFSFWLWLNLIKALLKFNRKGRII